MKLGLGLRFLHEGSMFVTLANGAVNLTHPHPLLRNALHMYARLSHGPLACYQGSGSPT